MRAAVFALIVVPIVLVSCLSPSTRLELQQARETVARLATQVREAEATQDQKYTDLLVQLNAARIALAKVEEKATTETTEKTSEAVEQTANALGPIVGTFFPGAAIALAGIGTAAGAIRRKAAKKRKEAGG